MKSSTSSATILIIEDDINALKVLTGYLSKFNYTVLVAKNSRTGLQRALRAQPDIILLDILLPDEDGFATCRYLKANEATKDIPVIFLTALNSTEDEIKGYQVGAADFISKPLHEKSILTRINTQLRLHELTERLEQKVQERTQELLQANQLLEEEIQERIVAETSLRESEERYRTLVENAPVCIHEIDLNGRLTAMNATGLAMLNLEDQSQIVGSNYLECVGIDDRPKVTKILAQAYQGTFSRFEFASGEEGDSTLFSSCFAPILDDDGNIQKLMGITEDITERKQAEEALFQAANLLYNVINTSQDWIFVKDTELRTILCNEAFARALGKTPDQLLGKTDIENGWNSDMVRGNQQRGFRGFENDDREVLSGKTLHLTPDPGHADGEERAFDTIKTPLRDESGNIIGVLGVARDITERIRAEEELYLSDELLKQMPDTVLMVDLNGTIQRWLGNAETMYGYTAEEAIGRSVSMLHHPDIRESMRPQIIQEVKETGKFVGEVRCVHKNGSEIPVELTVKMVFDKGGNPLALISNSKDISHRKEIEAQVQRSQRMAAIGQLSTGIAHDFNNILSAITLYTELLLRNAENTAVTNDRLQVILQQSSRASNLVNQLLDFARRSALERKTINLMEPLRELLTLLQRMLSENILIELEHDASEYLVHADSTRLQQVFMNLAVNARDAMPQGGLLKIRVSQIKVLTEDELPYPELEVGSWVRIRVSDSGEGMPPEIVERVFEPFFTTKDPGKGTGLGLAQVYGIIKQHDGYIFIDSEPGQGSSFTIFLPALRQKDADAQLIQPHQQLSVGQGETILVVEDNPDTREAVVNSLEMLNYSVIVAENGQEALQILEQKKAHIDLMLSDMIMPIMGGTELLQTMRHQDVHLPIVMLSGYFLEDELEQLRDLGMVAWLPKPPELAQLAQTIHQTLKSA